MINVDLVVRVPASCTCPGAIEVKATRSVSARDLKGLRALAEEGMMKHLVLVCQEPTPRKIGSILVLPWHQLLERLWSDAFVG
jgi:hypothetical protein